MAKKKVKPVEVEAPEAEPVPAAEPPTGPAVLYVLAAGPNAGAIRPATLLDQGGPHERIEVQTEPGDGLPMPLNLSLTQYTNGPQAPVWNGEQLPGTWHWATP